MLIISGILIAVSTVLFLCGYSMNNDAESMAANFLLSGKTTPGETLILWGSITLMAGLILIFVSMFRKKLPTVAATLWASLDFVIASGLSFLGMILVLYGEHSNNDIGDLVKSAVLDNQMPGANAMLFGIIAVCIGNAVLLFSILKRLFSTETTLSLLTGTAAVVSSGFLLMTPLFGIQAPGTNYVILDVQTIGVQSNRTASQNEFFNILGVQTECNAEPILNFFCSLSFLCLFASLIAVIISQFINTPKISLISSSSYFGVLIIMFIGVTAIYSMYDRTSLTPVHSIAVYPYYGICLLLSVFMLVTTIVKVNLSEN